MIDDLDVWKEWLNGDLLVYIPMAGGLVLTAILYWQERRKARREKEVPRPESKPPLADILPLDTEILRFLVGLENQHCLPMTNSDVHSEFLDEATLVLDERLIHLEGSGYITAAVTPTPTLGIPDLKKIKIHGLTEKGRKAI